jgi:hypothetical protein
MGERSAEQLLREVFGFESEQVARAASDCGVRRLDLASSLQAVSGYPVGRPPHRVAGRLKKRRWSMSKSPAAVRRTCEKQVPGY